MGWEQKCHPCFFISAALASSFGVADDIATILGRCRMAGHFWSVSWAGLLVDVEDLTCNTPECWYSICWYAAVSLVTSLAAGATVPAVAWAVTVAACMYLGFWGCFDAMYFELAALIWVALWESFIPAIVLFSS
jgi:hypothetical protein